jgi:hypothetical protein
LCYLGCEKKAAFVSTPQLCKWIGSCFHRLELASKIADMDRELFHQDFVDSFLQIEDIKILRHSAEEDLLCFELYATHFLMQCSDLIKAGFMTYTDNKGFRHERLWPSPHQSSYFYQAIREEDWHQAAYHIWYLLSCLLHGRLGLDLLQFKMSHITALSSIEEFEELKKQIVDRDKDEIYNRRAKLKEQLRARLNKKS